MSNTPFEMPFTIMDDEDDEIHVTLHYDVAHYHSAVMPSLNDPGCPAEGGEVTELRCSRGDEEFPLTEAEKQAAELHIYDNHNYYDYERGL